ncbi:ECF transporter S component [Oscillospiraceae bacterium WX1]
MQSANISSRVLLLARMAVLIAIVIIMTVFNFGNIPVGPIVATVYQVPVIIGAVLLGPIAGSVLGGIWGLLCFYLAVTGQTTDIVALGTVAQEPLAYFVIAFVPRVLTGLFAGYVYKLSNHLLKQKKDVVSFGISGVLGSLTNTVFYLGALYFLAKEIIAEKYQLALGAVLPLVGSVALTNGLAEAAVSCIIVIGVCKALRYFKIA